MSGYNPKRNEELKIDVLLSQAVESADGTRMTGQQGIDKMKEVLTGKGQWPCDASTAPPEWQDALLLRFFIGFKRNAPVAAEAFGKMLQWRKDNKINEIRDKIMGGLQPEKFPRYEQLRRFYPLLKTGFDKNGCPIMITLTGLIDPAKLIKAATLDEIRMYIIYEMEHKLIQLSKLTADTGVLMRALEVHDLKGLGMHHLATGPIGLLRKIVSEVSSNYVELADKVLLLNVPYATVVRSILKQVVPARSQHKLAVMGGLADYQDCLLAHAGRGQYHEYLLGGALPEGLEESGEDDIDKWSSISVPARDKKVLQESVGKGKTFLWSVCPASMDVILDVRFVAAKGAVTNLFEAEDKKIASLQRGSHLAQEDGAVYVTLDNTYSYINSKTVQYTFESIDVQKQVDDAGGPVQPDDI